MSLYKKSWLFAVWMIVAVCTFPYWMPLFEKLLGPFGFVAGFAVLIGHGVLATWCFYCPECGLSPFQSNKGLIAGYSPFPRRKCGHCGHDHTASP